MLGKSKLVQFVHVCLELVGVAEARLVTEWQVERLPAEAARHKLPDLAA